MTDRAHRRRQRRVHPQPAGRHPVVPGAARRGDRPPRHRRRPAADRRADGALDGRRPRRRRPRSRRTSTGGRRSPGADVVIDTIQVGGARATQLDFDIPARYGLRYTINDTINVGGVLRGPADDPGRRWGSPRTWRSVCPDALFLNYTNPMAMLVRAVDEAIGVPTVGLCHSVYWTVDALAGYIGVPLAEVDALSARRQPPRLGPAPRAPRPRPVSGPARRSSTRARVPDDDLVRAELYRRFGFYPTESSEHHAEYNPWFIPKGLVERFHIPIGEYLDRVSRTTSTSTRRPSAGSTPASRSRSSAAASTRPSSSTHRRPASRRGSWRTS